MIKNIVFDMGKVLVEYDSMRVCRHYIEDPQDRELVNTAVFISPEWVMLDMGVISDEEALGRICRRLPERLHEKAALCLRDWNKYCMWTLPGTAQLIRELKEKGYGVYLCSNAAIRLLDCYRDVIPEPDLFDGMLFSAEVRCMKPQREMYEHLFRRFDLKPEECFFIDDLPMNIEGARAAGMDGYCYENQELEKLRKVLDTLS